MGDTSLSNSLGSISLIVATVVISLIGFANEHFWRFLALEPYKMTRTHQYHPVITSGFVHGSVGHLFMNMITLFFFGPALEQTVGGEVFLLIYMVSLITGSIYPLIKYREVPDYVAIGASGAISGVLFSYCLFYPLNTIHVYFFPMPAIVFAVLYVAYSVFAMRNRQDNIGHEAHLAGALGGVIVTMIAYPGVLTNIRDMLNL
jgi:membrane associated rhomboid family serine protease